MSEILNTVQYFHKLVVRGGLEGKGVREGSAKIFSGCGRGVLGCVWWWGEVVQNGVWWMGV